jgi:hypothetical protein
MPDLALNLFLSLRGHVEPASSNLIQINPLQNYVENKAGTPESRFPSTVIFDNALA